MNNIPFAWPLRVVACALLLLSCGNAGSNETPTNAVKATSAKSVSATQIPTATPPRCDPADSQAVLSQIVALSRRVQANFSAAGKKPVLKIDILMESLDITGKATNIKPVTDCTFPVLKAFLLFIDTMNNATVDAVDGRLVSTTQVQARADELTKAMADLNAASGP